MLPLPRRRLEPDDVRARLRALASGGAPAEREPELAPFDDLLVLGQDSSDAPTEVSHTPTRAVVVAIAATAMAAWLVVHLTSGGAPSPLELVPGTPIAAASSAATSSSGNASGAASPSPSASDVVVQVVGEVRRPGLVRLSGGSRVADAVAAAGGLARGGSSGGLNLARPVVDGEQIVVTRDVTIATGGGGVASGGTSSSTPAVVVDLNTATASDLDALPGVGPVMAGRILDWRGTHGRFAAVDQLREISGIGARTFEHLKPLVRV